MMVGETHIWFTVERPATENMEFQAVGQMISLSFPTAKTERKRILNLIQTIQGQAFMK